MFKLSLGSKSAGLFLLLLVVSVTGLTGCTEEEFTYDSAKNTEQVIETLQKAQGGNVDKPGYFSKAQVQGASDAIFGGCVKSSTGVQNQLPKLADSKDGQLANVFIKGFESSNAAAKQLVNVEEFYAGNEVKDNVSLFRFHNVLVLYKFDKNYQGVKTPTEGKLYRTIKKAVADAEKAPKGTACDLKP